MVQASLVDYIKKYKDEYGIEKLRSYLIQQGYSPVDVEQAISIAIKKSFINWKILIIIIILITITFTLLAYFTLEEEKISVFLTIQPSTQLIFQEMPLQFTIFLRSTSEKLIRVDLFYNIYNINNELLFEKADKILFKKLQQFPVSIPLKLSSGKYFLKTELKYEDQVIEKQFSFEVKEKIEAPLVIGEKALLTCEPECNDYNACTKDICRGTMCAYETITPCCGNNVCEKNELLSCSQDCLQPIVQTGLFEKAEELSASSPENAVQICLSVPNRESECLYYLAEKNKNSVFCAAIKERIVKDSCYTDHATRTKEYSVCNKISDEFLQRSCLMQKNLYESI
ncbi:hypothetical protein HYV79_00590 [Candidatus Woesearchaeota archaeon]|nr:hypothetical protein [Candidatus Woesearchaeota archaeon]